MTTTGINLGLQPKLLRVFLTTNSDFQCTLRLNENWPEGATVEIVFPSGITTWEASISTTDAVFNVDKDTTNGIPDGEPVRLVYTNGTTDQVWAVGTVKRNG